ncbi:DUF3558 family protein [Cryptosporangium aurantiacum]|uniref:DUF3558 domain-containing protein n=1 Tax=Cryptosporangium aurantiacum TaxID=134849 RepID=A0A1M7JU72_9ACTN|nr:DUF3558 family protein [Cryptosporangium aurantiacum]SHM56283.1 Protein of unknown function [Cryptosporangium aurantiacum]
MTARTVRVLLAATAATGLFALTACGSIDVSTDDAAPSPRPTTSAASASPTVEPTTDTAADSGEVPNPCELLTPADVNALTSREITQVDRGDADSGPTRTCQWQLEEGVLAVFLSPTSADDFAVRDPDAIDVDGVGDEAYTSAGHLFVRSGDLLVDVYATGAGDEAGDQTVATATAEKIISQL